MYPVTFSNQKAPTKSKVVNLLVLIGLLVLFSFNSDVRKGLDLAFSSSSETINFLLLTVASALFVGIVGYLFFFKKTNNDFTVDDQGIVVDSKKYLWIDIKDFHMLGDSQDERTGLGSIRRTGGFDVVNPYWHMNIYVLKTKSGFINKTVRLQVSEDRAAQFNEILSQHNITRETKTRMYFTGVNPWFILLFGVPFGLLCLWFLYGVWVNR